MTLAKTWRYGLFVFLLAMAAVVASYLRLHPSGTPSLPAPGQPETSRQALETFTGLVIDGPFRVTLAEGAPALTLTAEPALRDAFTADLRGGVLRLYLKDPVAVGQAAEITLGASSLATIELTGSARLAATGGFAPDVTVIAHDAAEAVLAGSCNRARLVAESAAVIDARGLACTALEATASGLAEIRQP